MPFSGLDACPFMFLGIYQWVLLVVLLDQQWGMHLVSGLPSVVSVWVAFPFQEVLQSLITSVMTVLDNGLHFVFHFTIFYVRWGPHVVGAFFLRLLIQL